MSVIQQLASQQGLKGSEADIRLAETLALSGDAVSIKELIDNLNNKDKNIQSDCIKTLYELGYRNPSLIAGYVGTFAGLLKSKNNRLVWGGMIALPTVADLSHEEVFASLDTIMETVRKGSVITIDNGLEILARLNKRPLYNSKTEPLLMEQLWKCPAKQLPMYIEKALPSVNKSNREIFVNLINLRMPECNLDSQKKRLEKALKKIGMIR